LDNVAYIGLSRQMTLRRELDIVANNLANADTAGFKVEQLLVEAEEGKGATNAGMKGPVQYVLDTGVARDFSTGELRLTGRPLDVAIEGEAFFQVGGPNGQRFTKDGRFGLDPQGRLVTAQGLPVLDESGGELTLDPKKGEPTISADGVISQGAERVGKLGVVRFETLSVLSKEGDNLFSNTSNATPIAAPDVRLRQGMLEGSNVKPILEITHLIEITRAYESAAKMVDQNNDLSRRTIERLGRVS
jgi:flagellar basal-body rod protein FlgF